MLTIDRTGNSCLISNEIANEMQLCFLNHTRIWLTPIATILFVDGAIKLETGLICEDDCFAGWALTVVNGKRGFA